MQDFLSDRTAVRRFVMTLLLTFAGIALSLAVIGIYSVTACTVSARMREVGIRMAFGADRLDVLKLVIKQGMGWVLGGLGLGLVLSLSLSRIIASQLFGISALDPVTIGVGILLIALISLTACAIPARRAAKVDPMDVLRYE
jgi:ABC-type antimicrobial peptide transport system permease subunit